MKKLLILSLILIGGVGIALLGQGPTVRNTSGMDPVAIFGIDGTGATRQLKTDSSGGIFSGGTVSGDADGLANNGLFVNNVPTVIFPHVFNGSTWDRMAGDVKGTFVHGPTTGIRCKATASTATTLTAFGGSCAAPGASLSLYITDITSSTNAAGIAADSYNTVKFGTGGTCGTGTTVLYAAMTAAAAQATVSDHFTTPLKVTANNELCWINSTAGTKDFTISGFIAP